MIFSRASFTSQNKNEGYVGWQFVRQTSPLNALNVSNKPLNIPGQHEDRSPHQ